jgi:hypothetical protein
VQPYTRPRLVPYAGGRSSRSSAGLPVASCRQNSFPWDYSSVGYRNRPHTRPTLHNTAPTVNRQSAVSTFLLLPLVLWIESDCVAAGPNCWLEMRHVPTSSSEGFPGWERFSKPHARTLALHRRGASIASAVRVQNAIFSAPMEHMTTHSHPSWVGPVRVNICRGKREKNSPYVKSTRTFLVLA